jgi:hypothetical protein
VAGGNQVFDVVITPLLVHLEEILSRNVDMQFFSLFVHFWATMFIPM